MTGIIVESSENVTLVGGGTVDPEALGRCVDMSGAIVAADGGADAVLAQGLMPAAVIGDFDSLSARARGTIPADRLHAVPEQDSTDFEKALSRIRAPLVLGLGFMGPRLDHMLAVYHGLVRMPERRCLLVGAAQVAFLCPPRLVLETDPGQVVSVFPLLPVTAASEGLHWPLDGLDLAPGRVIGTSNRAGGRDVAVAVDRPGLLVMLPLASLPRAVRALRSGAPWPVHA